MTKRELLRRLCQRGVGDEVVVNRVRHQIVEVVLYKEDEEKWLNLVFLDDKGREVAIEVEGDKLSLWQEIDFTLSFPDVRYGGETFIFVQDDSGCAMTQSETAEALKRILVPYWVFKAPSGRRLAVEVWNNKFCFYLAEAKVPKISL